MTKDIFTNFGSLPTVKLRAKVAKEFKENGAIAYEHGFNKPIVTIKGETWRCMYIDDRGMHLFRYGVGYNITKSFDEMTRSQLIALCNNVNEYYRYCTTKA